MANECSVGWPAPGVQGRLVAPETGLDVPVGAVGEILVRGANVMRGYHREPAHPAFREGWFHSGDLARQAPDGSFEVVGRSKDMIISGGENISPAEIENQLMKHPAVADGAVLRRGLDADKDQSYFLSALAPAVPAPGVPVQQWMCFHGSRRKMAIGFKLLCRIFPM